VNSKNNINEKIGVCHIKPDEDPRKYILQMIRQIAAIASKIKTLSPENQESFIERFEQESHGRPCLENFVESLTKALYKEGFVWKGTAIGPINKNNKRYLTNIVSPAIMSWVSTMNATDKKVFNTMSFNKRRQLFWNKIKYLNIMGPNGFYVQVGNYNKNGTRVKGSKAIRVLNNNYNNFNYNN
jgi:hypothetical protein